MSANMAGEASGGTAAGSGPSKATVETRGNCAVVSIDSKLLDEADLKALSMAVDQAGALPDVSLIIIDVSHVKLIPSLGLGAIVQMVSKCRARKQRLKIASACPAIRQVFTITRLDKVVELAPTVEAALE